MCKSCRMDSFGLFGDLFFGGGFRGRADPFFGGGGGDGVNRDYFAPVSQRAMNALEDAKNAFLAHLATVDTSKGPVTTEIIKFHLVPGMRKSFNKFVREYGCTGTSRQITRAEQDLFNKNRKSLFYFTSVKVTPEAQRAYLGKHPHAARAVTAPVASGSSSSASATTSASAASNSSAHLRDTDDKKLKRKLNQAAVQHAVSNHSIKKLNSLNKKKA